MIHRQILVNACVLGLLTGAANAQQRVFYELLPSSVLEADFCLGPCDCAMNTLIGPASGRFTLAFDHSDPLFDVYRVERVRLVGDIPDFQPIWLVGAGAYRVGGEVGVQHQLVLDLNMGLQQGLHFDSGLVPVNPEHPFPQIAIFIESHREEWECVQVRIRMLAEPDRCPADLNNDGEVSLADLTILLHNFGQAEGALNEESDMDGDQEVDIADLALLLSQFGTHCA